MASGPDVRVLRALRKLAFVFEYDGTNFSGWQLQPGQRTVHGEIAKALRVLLRASEPPIVHCSGRTDAGVHALYQVAHVETDCTIGLDTLRGGLNHFLPHDIAVLALADMPEDFHARRKAVSKTYLYRILNRHQRSALDRLRVWHVPRPLDVEAMREAAGVLVGEHDFSSFRAQRTDIRGTIRTVYGIELRKVGDEIHFRITANGFLKHMVRNVVGTLVEIGHGKRRPESMREILASRTRTSAGLCAPPHGLYLERVRYPEPYESLLRDGFAFRGVRPTGWNWDGIPSP